jgi:N-acetylneuraminate synthase
MGLGVSIAATTIGATVIEKHFTLDRNDGGIDSSFSLEPDELTQLVNETKNAHVALGHVTYQQGDQESSFKKYRRSLYFVNDLPIGTVITNKDIQALRPGDGLLPKYLSSLIGRTLKVEVTKGTPVAWDLLV